MEFRDVHELVINKLRSVVIRYRLPLSPQSLSCESIEQFEELLFVFIYARQKLAFERV